MSSTTTTITEFREQLLEAREQALTLREQAITLREQSLALREQALAAVAGQARPIILNSRLLAFGTRSEVARMLSQTPDTVTDLVAAGVLPPPCDLTSARKHNAPKTRGRRILLWDLYEVAEWVLKARRLPHPALTKVSCSPELSRSGSPLRAA